jgi:hypothetical protein
VACAVGIPRSVAQKLKRDRPINGEQSERGRYFLAARIFDHDPFDHEGWMTWALSAKEVKGPTSFEAGVSLTEEERDQDQNVPCLLIAQLQF